MTEYKENLKMKSWHFVVFLSVVFFSLLIFRLIYSNPIEFNDESIFKWQLGRAIFETKDWSLLLPEDTHEAHHELRWSVIIPQFLLASFSFQGYANYFITPMLFHSLFTVLCIAMYGRTTEALLFGILLGLVISFEPMGHVMASQVNTGAFGLLYMIVAFWCLLKYLENGGWGKVILCALFCFFAYGAHVTYLVFWVVPVIFLVINRNDYKLAVLFVALLGIFYSIEVWVLDLISDGAVDGGRINRIWEAKESGLATNAWARPGEQLSMGGAIQHTQGGDVFEVRHFFSRWWQIPKYDSLIIISFLMGSFALLVPGIRKAMSPGIWLSFYGASIYGLAVSFPIIGLNPIQLLFDFHSRYLALFFPLASIFIVWLAYFLVSYCSQTARWLVPAFFIVILSSTFFLGTTTVDCTEELGDMGNRDAASGKIETTYCKLFRYSQEQNIYPKPNAFIFRANKYYEDFNDNYISGQVALFGESRIGVFRSFVRVQFPNASFIETENGWYSIDGEDKNRCVMELGQTETPYDNYRDCTGTKMERGIFN